MRETRDNEGKNKRKGCIFTSDKSVGLIVCFVLFFQKNMTLHNCSVNLYPLVYVLFFPCSFSSHPIRWCGCEYMERSHHRTNDEAMISR